MNRSASVDLPWSMCAMMEKFRMRSGFTGLAWALSAPHVKKAPEAPFSGSLTGA
jgi:hypothetical protein